jgi:hypothetical protein
MPLIRNRLNQKIVINLESGKNIDILAKGTAVVPDTSLTSPHLQSFLRKGSIVVSEMEEVPEKQEEEKRTSYVKKDKSKSSI